ncbi:MAG TPA: hypothetical protein VFQ71_08905 [Gaiellales bacterium]|jgi:hypothetical protein|nr:hypothetical protein [Gaiellales bacterium]
MTDFRDAFLAARRRIDAGADPEQVVPALLDSAEAQEEIDLATGLYRDGDADGDG